MKCIKSLFAFATFFTINTASADELVKKWTQIKAYHEVITKTFQSNEVNLDSMKSNSKILLEIAENLTVETMPEEFRNPKVIETLLTLKKNTLLVNDLVKNSASDTEIKEASQVLFSTFEKIKKLCVT